MQHWLIQLSQYSSGALFLRTEPKGFLVDYGRKICAFFMFVACSQMLVHLSYIVLFSLSSLQPVFSIYSQHHLLFLTVHFGFQWHRTVYTPCVHHAQGSTIISLRGDVSYSIWSCNFICMEIPLLLHRWSWANIPGILCDSSFSSLLSSSANLFNHL